MADCCRPLKDYGLHGYTVTYDSARHGHVLTQCWGSVWPKAIPFCVVNVSISLILQFFEGFHGFHFHITDKGHSYLTLLVAFLMVTRVTVSLGRYNQVRSSLESLCCAQRQFIHQMIISSSDNMTQGAREWRHDVAYLSLLLLRSTMAMIDYPTEGIPAWEMPEFDTESRGVIKKQLNPEQATLGFAHREKVSECDDNVRVSVCVAFTLRQAVVAQRTRLEKPLAVFEELALLNTIDAIVNAYYGIRYFMMVPFPFPLVQMARTMVFFYAFTLPFALVEDVSIPAAHVVVIFFLTYGFLGLEYVSIDLENPFGNDANDFNNIRMAHVSFEDTYTVVADMDGDELADLLRRKMDGGPRPTKADDWLRPHLVV